MGSRTVDVGIYSFSLDAYQAKAYLNENGIVATVTGVQAGTLWGAPGLEAVRVTVLAEDAERATALLAEMKGSGHSASDTDDAAESDEAEPAQGEEAEPAEAEPEATETEVSPARSDVPESDDEQWARRTRALAMVGIGLWILFFAAILRLSSARARGDLTPRARRYLRHARIAVGITIALMGSFLLLLLKLRI